MKRHGLWRFHHQINAVRAIFPSAFDLRWWVRDELQQLNNLRQYRFNSSAFGDSFYTHARAIIRCANRYIRLYKQPVFRVADWNSLCWRIAARAHFDHHATLKACLLEHCHPRSRLRKSPWGEATEFDRPFAYDRHSIQARGKSLREARQRRIDSCCVVCGEPATKNFVYMGWAGRQRLFPELEELWGGTFSMCKSHRKRYRALERRAEQVNEARLLTNRIRRKLNESTKDTA